MKTINDNRQGGRSLFWRQPLCRSSELPMWSSNRLFRGWWWFSRSPVRSASGLYTAVVLFEAVLGTMIVGVPRNKTLSRVSQLTHLSPWREIGGDLGDNGTSAAPSAGPTEPVLIDKQDRPRTHIVTKVSDLVYVRETSLMNWTNRTRPGNDGRGERGTHTRHGETARRRTDGRRAC